MENESLYLEEEILEEDVENDVEKNVIEEKTEEIPEALESEKKENHEKGDKKVMVPLGILEDARRKYAKKIEDLTLELEKSQKEIEMAREDGRLDGLLEAEERADFRRTHSILATRGGSAGARPRKIKLTQEQLECAKNYGMSPEEYAKYI
jgi:hypothetical protein